MGQVWRVAPPVTLSRWDALTVWGLSRDGAVQVVAHVSTLPLLMLENEVVLVSVPCGCNLTGFL